MQQTVAEGVKYDPFSHLLIIDGIKFSPGFLATLARDEEWRGPLWIRRSPDGSTLEITSVDPRGENT